MLDQLLFILVALTVAALAWAAFQAIAVAAAGQKRKLHQRLSSDTRPDMQIRAARTVLLQEQTTGLPSFFNRMTPVQLLQRRVAQAFPDLPLGRFMVADGAIAVMGLAIAGVATGNLTAAILTAAVSAYLPFLVVFIRRSRRARQITQQLPEALDFLSRAMRAGQSFSTGLQMMSDELPEPLASEFRRCYDQHSLGQALEDALRDMAVRLESSDVAFFATAVVIQRQSGGDLAEVLRNISTMIRQRLRLQQSVKAKTAEGRFTGYIMLTFPVVMFLIAWTLNPDYGNVLLHTSLGHKLLGVAFGLQMLGLFLIKKITTVRV